MPSPVPFIHPTANIKCSLVKVLAQAEGVNGRCHDFSEKVMRELRDRQIFARSQCRFHLGFSLESEKEHQQGGQTISAKSDEATRGRKVQVV